MGQQDIHFHRLQWNTMLWQSKTKIVIDSAYRYMHTLAKYGPDFPCYLLHANIMRSWGT